MTWRTASKDLLPAAALFVIAATAPSFLEDDAAFFNYFANVTDPAPLFYYYGYVSFIAGPAAYALSGLPLAAQALLYRVVPFIALFICYRELVRLIAFGTGEREARWLALGSLLLVRGVDIHIWSNLTYAIWPALFAAVFHVLRVGAEGKGLSRIALAGVVLAALSSPLGVLVGVLLMVQATRARASRAVFATLGGAIVGLHLALLSQSPDSVVVVIDPLRMAWLFAHGYRTEFKLNTVAVVLSLGVLAFVVASEWRRPSRQGPDRFLIGALAAVGVASVGAYMLSDRFTLLDGGFRSQHVLTVMLAALVCLSRWILTLTDARRKALLVGLFLGVSGMTIAREAYFDLRGPLETALMKYRFLMVASQFRQDCRPDDGMVFEDSSTSPIVLCRPRDFAVGRHPIIAFPPSVGESADGEELKERPGLVVGKPLF